MRGGGHGSGSAGTAYTPQKEKKLHIKHFAGVLYLVFRYTPEGIFFLRRGLAAAILPWQTKVLYSVQGEPTRAFEVGTEVQYDSRLASIPHSG